MEPFASVLGTDPKHPDALTLAAFSSPAGTVIGPECLNALTAAALGPARVDLFAFVNLDEIRMADPAGAAQLRDQRETKGIRGRRAVRSLEVHLIPPRLTVLKQARTGETTPRLGSTILSTGNVSHGYRGRTLRRRSNGRQTSSAIDSCS